MGVVSSILGKLWTVYGHELVIVPPDRVAEQYDATPFMAQKNYARFWLAEVGGAPEGTGSARHAVGQCRRACPYSEAQTA